MGTEALRDFWPGIFADIARRSRAAVPAEEQIREAVPAHEPLMPAP
jgi:hypothetical protein